MSNVDYDEVEKFASLASRWWDKNSEFKPLHEINPLRLNYIKEHCGGSLQGKRILDVGCGLGDLVPYIEDVTDGDFHYTGIDVAPSLIAAAKKKFQHPNVQFKCGDISSSLGESMFDVSILSGALNYRINDNIGNTEMVLSELFKITKETMSVNFLSSYVDYQEDKNFHYSPEAMLSFAKSLSTWVSIYHDYPLWEFTIQVRHNPIK